MEPVVRVSIFTVPHDRFDAAAEAMRAAEDGLSAIKRFAGFRAFFTGVDRERAQITNVSVWDSVEHAEQLSTFQPMLDLGKKFVAEYGATFVRPIPDFQCLWQWGDVLR